MVGITVPSDCVLVGVGVEDMDEVEGCLVGLGVGLGVKNGGRVDLSCGKIGGFLGLIMTE